MGKKKLTWIANAHIDPVWQWNLEEGVGATLSTFRSAADIAEESDGFVFTHNESMLYAWVERFSPSLFAKIGKLVRQGKWHIAGGWFLQPDCNMPSGESIIRQIKKGRNYFAQKFGVQPHVAVNYDSFGHSDGLVQILQDAGYTGYICFRPNDESLEERDYIWQGFVGSKVLLHRSPEGYNTLLGHVDDRLQHYLRRMERHDKDLMLWGVGNHGGGPSRCDLRTLNQAKANNTEIEMEHGTPEGYFAELDASTLPVLKENGLNYVMQACYSSQIEIKRLHIRLENELYTTERLNARVAAAGGPDFTAQLAEAEEDLLFCEFHDILPGTCIAEVEERAVAQLHHGLHIVGKVRMCLLYATCNGKSAQKDEFPLFVYNPLPYDAEVCIQPEMMLSDQNWSLTEKYEPELYDGNTPLQVQSVKEESNIPLDWRKRFAARVWVKAGEVKRLRCYFKPQPAQDVKAVELMPFANKYMKFAVNPSDGTVYYEAAKQAIVRRGGVLRVRKSTCDPWGFDFDRQKEDLGEFRLATKEEAARIACDDGAEAVRIIEDGPVLRTYEVVTVYGASYAVIRYTVYRDEPYVDVSLRLFNTLADVTVKLEFDSALTHPSVRGRTMFGENNLEEGCETVAQQRVTLDDGTHALAVCNDACYGLHHNDGSLYMTLLHPAAYTAHPIEDRKILKSDRCYPRFDQGTHIYRFRLYGGTAEQVEQNAGFVTDSFLCPPVTLQYNPTDEQSIVPLALHIDNRAVAVSCFKCADDGEGYILRLYNTRREQVQSLVTVGNDAPHSVRLQGYQFQTYRIAGGEWSKVNCLEKTGGKI